MKKIRLTLSGRDFTEWLERKGWNNAKVARELGCSRTSVTKWRRHGAPRYVELALKGLDAETPEKNRRVLFGRLLNLED